MPFTMTGERKRIRGSAKRLRGIRVQLGLSQVRFARLLGVNGNTLARWERGDLIPPKLAELAAEYLWLTHRQNKGGKS